ncbi:MAG: hypothetical protein M1820_007971 [Bogoriella megaspora]|nr:MAG: hypothetical protein M1820_007971 [Bogoriella megaspora]
MTFQGSATHGGGSCQISLSYDYGATFRVIKSIIGGCPLTEKYNYAIPSYAPSGTALLAWSWQNHEGNREFYMNCAAVTISGSSSARRKNRRAVTASGMDNLPYIWVANLPDVNSCTTAEGVDPVYPDPGPDVEYGAGLSKSSPSSPKDCEASKPGPAYKDLGGSSSGSESSPPSPPPDSGPPPVASSVTSFGSGMIGISPTSQVPAPTSAPPYSVVPVDGGPQTTGAGGQFAPLQESTSSAVVSVSTTNAPSSSTLRVAERLLLVTITDSTTITTTQHTRSTLSTSQSVYTSPTVQTYQDSSHDVERPAAVDSIAPCASIPPTQTVTVTATPFTCTNPPTVTTTITISTNARLTSTSSHINSSVAISTTTICTICASPTPSSPSPLTNPQTSTGTVTAAPSISSPNPSTIPSPASSNPRPNYAQGDYSAYLPCVPGTFLCTSSTTFLTCDVSSSNAPNTWLNSRDVAAGMECLPNLSPFTSSTSTYQSSAGSGSGSAVPQGYYRDDRYIRSRPDGTCTGEGQIQCYTGGDGFYVCDNGGLVDMGKVAAGTACHGGAIVVGS